MTACIRLVTGGHAVFRRVFLLLRVDERFGLSPGTSEREPLGWQDTLIAYELLRQAQEMAGDGGKPE